MEYFDREKLQREINRLSTLNTPFMFLIDFKGARGVAIELADLTDRGIYCSINGIELGKKSLENKSETSSMSIDIDPIPFSLYKKGFDKVAQHIAHGDSYLLNLTYRTRLSGQINMQDIYNKAKSRYKFMLDGCFLFYSPEPFVKVDNGMIYSYPMKGTILSSEDGAKEKLINNKKELYEHYTIVDLIRNDLSMVSSDVRVEDFRYLDSIQTIKGEILQTSTKISGKLSNDWQCKLGDILFTLIPAGSVSGAPKNKTVQIIEDSEISERGFYTGIMGVYEEGKVDSCVIIRYIEKSEDGNFYYRSGGGITSLSDAEEEYQELLSKIYIPIK